MGLKELLEERRDLLKVYVEGQEIDLLEELYFDADESILEHLECQAGMVAFWNAIYRQAEAELKDLEHDYDMWYAPLYEQMYQRLWEELGYKRSSKPNISSVENAIKVKRKKAYSQWHGRLREARVQVAILKDVVKWWSEKGQMLIQAAKFVAAEERATDWRISKEKRQTEEVRQLKRKMREGKGK